ncbi:LicD family protein [Methanobrevibacter sp.]|uniref:LicD family protein n=1 Tax=Methanobrevibacter sp. TaxID=66852 RepID=UPI00388F4E84
MGIKDKISKAFKSEDLIESQKDCINDLDKRIEKLEKNNENLSIIKMNKEIKNISKSNKTTNRLFITLYMDHELEKTELFSKFRQLELEYIKLIDNIFKKHNIDWMIESRSFLGAIRHGGFIPWDDGIKCGMTRQEYNRFREILPKEIEELGLADSTRIKYSKPKGENITSILQLFYYNSFKEIRLMRIDFFPYDFIKEYDEENFQKQYDDAKEKFFEDLSELDDYNQVLENYYGNLNLTYEKTPYMVKGVEGTIAEDDCVVFETDRIMPYKNVKFEDLTLPGPKDYDYYLKSVYKSYWMMPKDFKIQNNMKEIRERPNNMEMLDKHIGKLREINDKFE